MAKTILNVKTDREVKKEAQRVAEDLGVPLSTVVNAFLKQFIRERKVTFSAEPTMNSLLERRLSKVEADIRAGKNAAGSFSDKQEVRGYLNALKRKR